VTAVDSPVAQALQDRYAIERELGHGGMATVYLATDLKHRRRVAVKVLRPELAATLGVDRFLSEIELAAGLQHPHILPLLDSGEAGGFLYYVMPYVDGESLRERLARQGELPVSDAVRILAETAEALDYAHRQGVVHRDLKPDNIMLSGRHPLVMDFGIAKAIGQPEGSRRVTTAGVALGTPAYMAPEQAAADPHVDHRADLYAFGVMGYELLTGAPPFGGTTSQQVLAAHMTQRPEPISSRRPSVPPALATIIMHCLEKHPADRPQRAAEIVLAFEALITPSQGLTPTATRPLPSAPRRATLRPLLLGGTLLLALALGLLWRGRALPTAKAVSRHTQLTFVGDVQREEISPDGQLLAYIEQGDSLRLFVKDLSGGSVIPIASLGPYDMIRWSPDGASLFHLGHDAGEWRARLLPRFGGTPRPLPAPPFAQTGVLSPDGSQLAAWGQPPETPIVITTLATGATRSINTPESLGFRVEGDWSPDGHLLALLAVARSETRYTLVAGEVVDTRWHVLVSDTLPLSPPRWAPNSDALYFLHDGSELRKVGVATNGERRGAPEVIQSGLEAAGFSVTADGRMLAYVKEQRHSNLWLATRPRRGKQFTTTQITRGTAQKSGNQISPDGRQLAYVQTEQNRGDVYVLPLGGGAPRRLTSGPALGYSPAWSPDGRRLAFVTIVNGVNKVRTVSVEGGEERTYDRTEVSPGLQVAWAPFERMLYQRPGNRNFNWVDPTSGAEEPLVTNDSVGWMFNPVPSPDRRHVAVSWNRPPNPGVYVISVADGSQTRVGKPDDWAWPLGWSADGAFVYVEDEADNRIRRVPLEGGPGVVIARNPFTIDNPFRVADCASREEAGILSMTCFVEDAVRDAWAITNFDPGWSSQDTK
jgi:serine/threonine-protein kinase